MNVSLSIISDFCIVVRYAIQTCMTRKRKNESFFFLFKKSNVKTKWRLFRSSFRSGWWFITKKKVEKMKNVIFSFHISSDVSFLIFLTSKIDKRNVKRDTHTKWERKRLHMRACVRAFSAKAITSGAHVV